MTGKSGKAESKDNEFGLTRKVSPDTGSHFGSLENGKSVLSFGPLTVFVNFFNS
jgi:hypothetical protein